MEQNNSKPKKKRKRNAYKPNMFEANCKLCNKLFKACRPWQNFCSQKCRITSGNVRVSEALRALNQAEQGS